MFWALFYVMEAGAIMTILMQHGGDKKAAVRSAVSYADLRNHSVVHCFWGLVLAAWHLILFGALPS